MRASANYTPYKTAPPRSRVVNDRSRSPGRYNKVTRSSSRKSRKRMSTKKEMKVRKITKKRKLRSQRKMEAINMIDYGDAYRTPDTYYVRDSRAGKVYSCPPPKHNLLHVNEDPTLGGTTYKKPAPPGIWSSFNTATKKTPISSNFTRVIPWDHKNKDFVYGSVQDACFKGFYDRRSLKSKIDLNRKHSSWDPVSCYNLCFAATLGLIAVAVIVWLILMILKWDHFKSNWVWWLFWLAVIIAVLVCFCCIFKAGANARTKKRFQRIDEACQDINNRNLYNTGTRVYPGESGAWLEVEMDPKRTTIGGPIRHDAMSYSMDNTPNMAKRIVNVPPRGATTTVVEETVVRAGSGGINDISRSNSVRNSQNVMMDNSRPPSQIEDPMGMESGYERLPNNDSVYMSNYPQAPQARASYASSKGNSAKKMSFYEKLRKSKAQKSQIGNSQYSNNFNNNGGSMMNGSFANPVSGAGRSVNGGNSFVGGRGSFGVGGSRSPRNFETTGAPLNLMAKSPSRR